MGAGSDRPAVAKREQSRILWLYGTALVVYLVVFTAYGLVFHKLTGRSGVLWIAVLFAPQFVLMILYRVLLVRSFRRWQRDCIKSDYQLCPNCGYDLSMQARASQDTKLICPECGADVDPQGAQTQWRRFADTGSRKEAKMDSRP